MGSLWGFDVLLSLAHAGHERLMTVATLFHSCSICLLSKWNLSLLWLGWGYGANQPQVLDSKLPLSPHQDPLLTRLWTTGTWTFLLLPGPAGQIDWVNVVAPSQVSTGTTPTTISPLHWKSESLGLSPHCVSLGSSLTFPGLSLSICKMKRKEMLSATDCSEL